MAFLQWRRFNFFDKEVVKENDGKVFEKLKDININACTSGRGYMIFGDVEGFIHMLNRQLELIYFRAFELTVNHLHQLRQNGILVSVGEDIPGNNSVIKIWNLDKLDKNGIPTCTRTVSAGNRETPVTALAVNENMNMMALGYDNGSVLLFRGDITRDRGSKQKILHEGAHPVTGLSFRTVPKITHLFVATTDNIFAYNVSLKDKEQQFHLDSHGCIPRCSTMSDAKLEYQFVIARTEAVYFYQPDGRGPCFAFDGEKIILHWFRSYLVIVGKDRTSVRPSTVSSHTLAMNIVTVYDIQNKFIAYSAPLPEVIDILSEWGSLYVLGGDKKLYHLQEKDTQSKLDTLFKKSLYALAIELAKTQQYDEEGVVDIFRQYGDHLYSKGDHDGAIEQYIKTIGKLEASYVIRKFLDAQRIHNLTAYLQALHKQGLATEDHTTLLLNCYTKLKANDKLDEFIKTKNGDIDFDIEIAIRVCRQASYYDHALYLAEKHSQHDWYLKIQIEDLQQYQKALEYISKLEFEEAESNMKKYGKVLLTEVPEKTTELLKLLCTNYRPSDKPLIDANMLDDSIKQIQRAEAKDFIHIFVKNSKRLQEFLEHIIKVQRQSQSLVYNTLLELYLQEYMHENNPAAQAIREKTIMNLLEMPDAGYDLDQALVLCQMNNFKPGLLYLYEKAKLYQQILQYHMARTDYDNIIVTCKHFGSQDPNLWVQALWFFSKTDDNQKNYLIEVLHHIEQKKLLSPLMVINILSNSSTATLGVVKEYIIRQLEKENHQIAEDERLIQQYREATHAMRNEIEDIKTNAKIFKVAKCSACNQQLELPSVHFLCHHSYHLHCFESYAENENECPACTTENRKILDIIRAQEQSKDLHEQFHHLLDNAEDGFSVVSEYFGRGIFNRVTLITDLPSKNKSPLSSVREQIFEPEFSLPGLSFRPENRQLPSQVPSLNPFESPQGLNPFEDYDEQLNPFKS